MRMSGKIRAFTASATPKAAYFLDRAMKEVLRKDEIHRAIAEKWPKTSSIPKEAVPAVAEIAQEGRKTSKFAYEEGAANKSVSLRAGFEHLSYQLGRLPARQGMVLASNRESFSLDSIENEILGEMPLGVDELCEHASLPVGYVQGRSGALFMIFQLRGKLVQSGKKADKALTEYERGRTASAVVERLAKLHSAGFACGGLKASDVEMSDGNALVKNASRIVAMDAGDSLFHEAAYTLHSLKAAGLANARQLRKLAREYLSHSPITRNSVEAHLKEKKLSGRPHEELASAAERFGLYFPKHYLKEVA
ncbi:Uncharacterised protein [uncultured archaeon]|nr:Uncharacterised protein [uncultured archaeon]